MIYATLTETVHPDFKAGECHWIRIKEGCRYHIRHKTPKGWFETPVQRSQFEILIVDPQDEYCFNVPKLERNTPKFKEGGE